MATPLTDAINALTTYANTVTGASDTTLSDAVGTLAAGYGGGGGGSGMPLLDVITVSENVRAVNLDLTPYQTCDAVIIFSDVTLSASDWLYYVKNGSAPSGGTYGSSKVHHYGMCFGLWLGSSDSFKYSLCPQAGGYQTAVGSVSNLYIYTYSASKSFLAGSKFYIYGGTYADLLQ